ncbi:MAG: hypothetical protein Q4E53_10535 [Eubacteriales bacterium]|nr:hypothetical protein [Eubacteriales bacterium]
MQEKKLLQNAYLNTLFGQENYHNYRTIKDFLDYMQEEMNHYQPLSEDSDPIMGTNLTNQMNRLTEQEIYSLSKSTSSNTDPFFHLLENHPSVTRELYRLLHRADPDQTIYIKLHEPFQEVLSTILDHILVFGPQKMEIILCIAGNNTFHDLEPFSYLKTICEIVLHNKHAKIMMHYEAYSELYHTVNWILVGPYSLQFDREIQNGFLTNYPEWLQNIMVHFEHMRTVANNLVKDTTVLPEQPSSVLIKWHNKSHTESVSIRMIEKNGTCHTLHFYEKKILHCFKSYFDIKKHPNFSKKHQNKFQK